MTPDITLPSIDDFLPIGEADLPRALMWDEIKPTPFDGLSLNQAFVQPLLAASRARQETLEEFAYLRKNIDRFKLRFDQKEVPLNLAERQALKQSDDDFKKAMDAERDRLAKNNYPVREFKLDSVLRSAAATPEKKEPAATPATDAEEGDTDSFEPEIQSRLDVHLREALRVVSDALRLGQDQQYWADGHAPLTTAHKG